MLIRESLLIPYSTAFLTIVIFRFLWLHVSLVFKVILCSYGCQSSQKIQTIKLTTTRHPQTANQLSRNDI